MRWPWQKKPEPVAIPEDARWVSTRSGRVLVVPPESDVVMMPVVQSQTRHSPVMHPKWRIDHYDIEPAFHVRYEQVKVGTMIDLKALRNNINMAKLQAKEVVTDPKRVVRRQWHKYLIERRWRQIVDDSALFYGPRR